VSVSTTTALPKSPPRDTGPQRGSAPRHDRGISLRIGLMTDTYLPIANGVTHMVSLLARQLAAWGHEPHIFTFAPTMDLRMAPEGLLSSSPHLLRVPPRVLDSEEKGVHVHHAPALPLFNSGYFLGMRYPVWMKQLLREMDIIHVHHPFISGRLALRIALPEQPLIFTNQTRYDIYSHYVQRVVPFVPTEAVGERLTRRAAQFANRCDAVIAPSASLAQVLGTWGVTTPVEVIPNGIELERFHRAVNQGAARTGASEYSQKSAMRNPVVVYLGRLALEKNCETLLDAFALAHREVPTARLVLIGDGPVEADLQRHAQTLGLQDCVTFRGALPYEAVPQALAECDIFASASFSEVHPLTFIEAMAAGLPCVGTDSPGVVDTVVDGRNGWLAAPQVDELARTLVVALSDADERARRAANALHDSRPYAIETTAQRVLDLYRSIYQSKTARSAA
jgi:1,2-diacylglycerol 3-alpha-glucosyltransferase